jgi:glutaredoxin 3
MRVLIYSKKTCPFCVRAKTLLEEKKVSFEEIDISDDPSLRSEMIKKASGRTTVPQIFINGQHVGGCDDLYALQRQGKLDVLLAS